jgi:hypothetical protein
MAVRTCIISTVTKTKASTSGNSPFPEGLYSSKKMKVMLGFEESRAAIVKGQLGGGRWYFEKIPAWFTPLEDTSFGINLKTEKVYIRFLLLDVLEETFFHKGEEVSPEVALKYLPQRPSEKGINPVYMTVSLNNVRHFE